MTGRELVCQIEPGLKTDKSLIGGKAASLLTLSELGAAVPPAFVLTTEAYREWANSDDRKQFLRRIAADGVRGLEARCGRKLEGGGKGLIVSVRSGAPVSMPGMMDTVLNVGLGRVDAQCGAFLCAARARFIVQYAEIVLGVDEIELEPLRSGFEVCHDPATVNKLEDEVAQIVSKKGMIWPETPEEELLGAADAVFASWQSDRAKLYRRMRKIDDTLGTSVTVQQMVFGNRDDQSGSGVAFTRDPTSGIAGLCGEFLVGGQGEEVVAGRQTGRGIDRWRLFQSKLYEDLNDLGRHLEQTKKQVYEIEFTVDGGNLYVLQCRPALLTVKAAARIAVEMVEEGILNRDEALGYAKMHGFSPESECEGSVIGDGAVPIGKGLPVGGGVDAGILALSIARAEELLNAGEAVVFATVETSPGLLPIMQRAAALITMRGGATSHAAVVARELGIPCVVGVGAEIVGHQLCLNQHLREGELVTVDGDRGDIFSGDVSKRALLLSEFEKTLRGWAGVALVGSSGEKYEAKR